MNLGRPIDNNPAFSGWNPSTSFVGWIACITLSLSICFGKGNWTRIPWKLSSVLIFAIKLRSSSWETVYSRRCSSDFKPRASKRLVLFRT